MSERLLCHFMPRVAIAGISAGSSKGALRTDWGRNRLAGQEHPRGRRM